MMSTSVVDARAQKKKRRPAGTPDPDAEVVSLSPRTLLESDRYVCEICSQGFQRDQNLQMHRRRHKVPWKLLKRDPAAAGPAGDVRKRVFVCPEPSCLHHDPAHALGDLVGIKKHYRRKHSDRKQWVCDKCSKGYAVQSDYKAHLKTCGTRGHTCDCGKVFSRVESFIEHQDTCNANGSQLRSSTQIVPAPLSLSSSPTPSIDTNLSSVSPTPPLTPTPWSSFLRCQLPNLELQLLPTSSAPTPTTATRYRPPPPDNACSLNLSLGLGGNNYEEAEKARLTAKREIEVAEQEFANAKRIRQQAQAELDKALALRDRAANSIDSVLLQITCQSCKLKMWPAPMAQDHSLAASVVTDTEHK